MSDRVDVNALAARFAGIAVDAVLLDHDYDDVLVNLDPTELLVAVTLIEHASGDAVYAVPPNALRILAVWYDDRQLGRADLTTLEAVAVRWRDDVGTPNSFTTESEGDRQFRLYPTPNASSKPFSFPYGLPFGRDFPRYAVAVAATETRPLGIPDWLDMPVALAMLAKHFTREERYRDPLFAGAVRKLADRLLTMVA